MIFGGQEIDLSLCAMFVLMSYARRFPRTYRVEAIQGTVTPPPPPASGNVYAPGPLFMLVTYP